MSDTIRRVAFEEGVQGLEITFLNKDLRKLYTLYGEKFTEVINAKLLQFDIQAIDDCLKIGAKIDGAAPQKPITIDDLDGVTFETIQIKLLDAFSLAFNGRTWMEHQKWIEQKILERNAELEKLRPRMGREASSDLSSETPSEPVSESQNSGV